MSVKKYIVTKDNTISNLFLENLSDRGTSGNTGQSDILEIFSIYAQASSGSLEKARVLLDFPVGDILNDRNNSEIPSSGSVNFILNLFNAPHGQSTPRQYSIEASPILQSWEEGFGLDMETYLDKGASNWLSSSVDVKWAKTGSSHFHQDFNTSKNFTYAQYLENGLENIEVDITPAVEEWIKVASNPSSLSVAKALLTFSDVPAVSSSITLTDAFGTSKNFFFLNNDQPKVTGDTTGSYNIVLRGANVSSSIDNFVTALQDPSSGFITSSNQGFVFDKSQPWLSLTQSLSGAAGNTIINREGATNISTSNFSGGDGLSNYGMVIFLSGAYEDGSLEKSFYTKKFFARGSHHFFKRPSIEARWDDRKRDDRGSMYVSSSLVPPSENVYKIYFYNRFRGNLHNLPNPTPPNTGDINPVTQLSCSLYQAVGGPKVVLHDGKTHVSASSPSIGVYVAEFCVTGSGTYYDVWSNNEDKGTATAADDIYTEYRTGSSIIVKDIESESYHEDPQYVVKITNLQSSYRTNEKVTLRAHIREKNWQPNIYTKATNQIQTSNIKEAYYQIRRVSDNLVALPYSTGSIKYTALSYDISGSYFDLDLSLLEPNYSYEIGFLFKANNAYKEQKDKFKFRVEV